MSSVIEYVTIPVKSGISVQGNLEKALATISKQEGFQNAYWGYHEESPTTVDFAVQWSSLEAHKAFGSRPDFLPTLTLLKELNSASSRMSMHHVKFLPHPPIAVFTAPIVEICIYYSLSANFGQDIGSLMSILEKQKGGCIGVMHGFVLEDLSKNGSETSRAYSTAVGWTSLEAEQKAFQSPEVKDSLHLCQKGAGIVDIHHVQFKNVVRLL